MKKITILTLHLGYGGIEKCVSMLSNSLIDNYEIEIISAYKLYDKPPFEISENIKIKYLIDNDLAKKVESYKMNLKRLKLIKLFKELYRDYLKKGQIVSLIKDTLNSFKITKLKKTKMIEEIKNSDSDIIISTRDIYNEILGKYGKKETYKIAWEHNHHHNNQKYIKKLTKSVEKLNKFILVSQELKEFYQKKLKDKKCECIYIPNAIDYYPNTPSLLNQKNIISVGRIATEKGYNDLVDVFEIVSKLYPDWTLHIVGDGNLYGEIDNKIKTKNLNIVLHGFLKKDKINELLEQSSIYVMTSLTESFGLVLLEAFAYGIPCIAFDSAEGARVLIKDNWDGYLVKNRDKNQMAKRIIELIKGENRRIVMGDLGRKKVQEYLIDNVKDEWINLLEKEK